MKKTLPRRVVKTLFASTIMLGAVANPVATFAQDYDSLIQGTQAQIDAMSAQQAQIYSALQVAYGQINELYAQADQLTAMIAEDDATIADLQSQIKELEELIAKREELLQNQARAVQVSGGSSDYLNFVASSESLSDFVGRLDVVSRMVTANKDLITTQKDDKEAVVAKEAEVQATKDAKIGKLGELEAIKGDLQVQAANAEAAYGQLANDITLAANSRDALVAEKQAFEAEQARLAAEAQAQAAAAAQQQAAAAQQATAEQEGQTSQIAETTVVENGQTSSETSAPVTNTESTQAEVTTTAPVAATPAPKPAVTKPVATPAAPKATNTGYGNVVATAEQYIGTPYVWGGKNPSGFDCSGLVNYVYKQAYGKDLGGWTVPQESSGSRIGISEAKAGDLYFWGTPGSSYHVAIATGNGGYIHAPQPGETVTKSSVNYFSPDFAIRPY